MKIRLPISFELPIDTEQFEDLKIALGLAAARHEREMLFPVKRLHDLTPAMIEAFLAHDDKRQRLWSFLSKALDDAPLAQVPRRFKDLLILWILSDLFKVEGHVQESILDLHVDDEPKATWRIDLALTDSKGTGWGNFLTMSAPFDPSNYEASLTAFLGAVFDAFRESARGTFGMSELYDDQDIK